MRSDALFYELFQAAPQTFFELLQITPPCPYHFESIPVKSAEKRIDGVLEPEIEGLRIYFIEIQAYFDRLIYWRSLREVATCFEQRPNLFDNDWLAVILFLNRTDDPGPGTLVALAAGENPRIKTIDLLEILPQLDENALLLNVLRPLVTQSEAEVRQNILTWAYHIRQAHELDASAQQRLVNVLAQLVMQKFTSLTYKEMSKMLHLTPLEETIDGQELLQGQTIKLLLKLIETKFSLSPSAVEDINQELQSLSLESLESLFIEILNIETVEELEYWIQTHLPKSNGVGLPSSKLN